MPTEPHVLSLAEFKTLVAQGDRVPADAILRKQYVCDEIKQVADDERGIQFSISTEAVDRDSDTLNVQGWKLVNYRRNPVVLWAHDYSSLPVARSAKIWTEDHKLKTIDHFTERDINPFGDTVFQMVKAKYLNATSVGFLPLAYTPAPMDDTRRGGMDFTEQELLEHSIVPVPSNPESLVEARSMLRGADWMAYTKALERLLDVAHGEPMLVVPRTTLERAWRAADPAQRTSVPTRASMSERRALALLDDELDGLVAPADPLGLDDPAVITAVVAETVQQAVQRAFNAKTGRLPD